MATFCLVLMFGMLGLVVDLGWSYYVQKVAQSAVDTAALAAADRALEIAGDEASIVCGTRVVCQNQSPCPSSPPNPPVTNLDTGCLYARKNGFAANARRTLWIASDVTSPPPTAPGRRVDYWVTVHAGESIPQLFSAVLGNTVGYSGARATAAVVNANVDGSLILLNRQNDVGPVAVGTVLSGGGNARVRGRDGILMASTSATAGNISGQVRVEAPYTYIRGAGRVVLGGSATWVEPPENNFQDRTFFKDPLRGKGQPAPPTGLPDKPIDGGTIQGTSDPANPLVLQPGNYYATQTDKTTGVRSATGDPIRVSGNVRFSSGGSAFGNYVVFGGLHFPSSQTKATFEPGRYVLAGVKGNPGNVITFSNQVILTDNTPPVGGVPQPNTDPGQIFILTDSTYPGLQVPPEVQPIAHLLRFGRASLYGGNNSTTSINLHGLNGDHPAVPAELQPFAPIVFWQDQRNSTVSYTAEGQIAVDCEPGRSLDNPCRTGITNGSPGMHLQATPNTHLSGTVYQPRGAWLTLQGGGAVTVPVQVVTGAIDVQGGPDITLVGVPDPIKRRFVALIE